MNDLSIKLYEHQQRALEISRENPRFAFFWSPGTGKTITILSIWKERPMRTLVVASKAILSTAWARDSEMMGVPVINARHTNKRKRLELIREPGDHVVLTNYEQFRIHEKEFKETGFDRFVFDESSKLKNRDAKVSKAAHSFAESCREVYLLSGTPAPNCPTELWSQLRTISSSASGVSFWKWAHHFFVPIMQQKWTPKGQKSVIAKWVEKPERTQEFNDHLRKWSWSLRKEDCLDLPEQIDIVREVELSRDERKQYDELITELKLSVPVDEGPTANVSMNVHAEGLLMKLRQVVGGSVRMDDQPKEIGSSKIDALVETLEEFSNDQVVIWCEFRADIDRVARVLNQIGRRPAIIDGRTSSKVGEIVDSFVQGETDTIIAHPKAAGHGTDGLQKVSSVSVYFGLSFSAEEHEQSRDRIHRSGQSKSCLYIYLIAKDTVDESLLWVVRRKKSRQSALLKELGVKDDRTGRNRSR